MQPPEDVLGDPFFLGLGASDHLQVLGRLCYSLAYNVSKGTVRFGSGSHYSFEFSIALTLRAQDK